MRHEAHQKEITMDTVTLIRLIAGAAFAITLFVLIQRRRTRVE
jgi:hypothetical protein